MYLSAPFCAKMLLLCDKSLADEIFRRDARMYAFFPPPIVSFTFQPNLCEVLPLGGYVTPLLTGVPDGVVGESRRPC